MLVPFTVLDTLLRQEATLERGQLFINGIHSFSSRPQFTKRILAEEMRTNRVSTVSGQTQEDVIGKLLLLGNGIGISSLIAGGTLESKSLHNTADHPSDRPSRPPLHHHLEPLYKFALCGVLLQIEADAGYP